MVKVTCFLPLPAAQMLRLQGFEQLINQNAAVLKKNIEISCCVLV
jgi:hypothetical protein